MRLMLILNFQERGTILEYSGWDKVHIIDRRFIMLASRQHLLETPEYLSLLTHIFA
jgi:hypothetical protein